MRRNEIWLVSISGTVLVALLVLIFRPELRSLFGSSSPAAETSAVAEPPPPPSTPPSASASAPAVKPTPAPSAVPAEPAEPRPTTIAGRDADAWRLELKGANMRGDAGAALDAVAALAQIDPSRFDNTTVLGDAATAAHLAASTSDELGQKAFEMLAGDALGHAGPDVLYRITSLHGGSRAAKRAAKLLENEDVLKRATPALLIAIAIRDAPCKERPALFERASKEGDERTLYLLQAMQRGSCGQTGCCMRGNSKLDAAILALRERTRKG